MGSLFSTPVSLPAGNDQASILLAIGLAALVVAFFVLCGVLPAACVWLASIRSNQGWRLSRAVSEENAAVWGVDAPAPTPAEPPPKPGSSWALSGHLRTSYNQVLLPTVPLLGFTVGQLLVLASHCGCLAGAILVFNAAPTANPKRFSHVGIAQLPLLVALATKNSLLTALTGKSYAKLSFVHRFIGRLVFVCILVHGYTYTFNATQKQIQVGQPMRIFGIIAFSCLALPMLMGLRFIRKRIYQAFYLSHVVGYVGFLVFANIHRPQCRPWTIAALAPLVLDYLLRTLNTRVRYARLSRQRGNMTRVQVHSLDDSWRPGQHIFVRFMAGSMTLESHPVSIANAPCSIMPGRGLDLHVKAAGDWSIKLRDLAQKSAIELAADPNGDAARIVKCIVQGPYGGLTHRDPARFEACMLVAGGSGLTFALSVLEDLIGSALRGGRRRRTRTRIIALVWTARDADMVRTFAGQLQALLDLAKGLVFFSIRIHITGPPTEYDPDKLRRAIPAANLFAGRPDIAPLVDGIVNALIGPPDVWRNTPCRGGLHVLACGPPNVIVSVRKAVGGVARARAVQAGGIVVHSEAFT